MGSFGMPPSRSAYSSSNSSGGGNSCHSVFGGGGDSGSMPPVLDLSEFPTLTNCGGGGGLGGGGCGGLGGGGGGGLRSGLGGGGQGDAMPNTIPGAILAVPIVRLIRLEHLGYQQLVFFYPQAAEISEQNPHRAIIKKEFPINEEELRDVGVTEYGESKEIKTEVWKTNAEESKQDVVKVKREKFDENVDVKLEKSDVTAEDVRVKVEHAFLQESELVMKREKIDNEEEAGQKEGNNVRVIEMEKGKVHDSRVGGNFEMFEDAAFKVERVDNGTVHEELIIKDEEIDDYWEEGEDEIHKEEEKDEKEGIEDEDEDNDEEEEEEEEDVDDPDYIDRRRRRRPQNCTTFDNLRFSQKARLIKHDKIHPTGEKPYRCSTCNKCFSRKEHLTYHNRIHTGERPYKCSICNKGFSGMKDLKVHNRTHTGERPYRCSTCNKGFSVRGHLTFHERTHTGEKPYKCSSCSQDFSRKANLIRHEIIHSGERPYKCTICNKGFSQKGSLNIHNRIHTSETPFKCSICKKRFSRKDVLNNHKKSHSS
ncbi:zinc finger protein 568-like isoform X3 [Nilaparvata lugens]|uniref:zinc finger protein 568-like isoform X3 n=1 Tax=Nilaparvata lugens TaxID=108931 RepID=UPI00193D28AD|nr:zinc finger protein 568-like isoform X3 [Nilaparvata lugens]